MSDEKRRRLPSFEDVRGILNTPDCVVGRVGPVREPDRPIGEMDFDDIWDEVESLRDDRDALTATIARLEAEAQQYRDVMGTEGKRPRRLPDKDLMQFPALLAHLLGSLEAENARLKAEFAEEASVERIALRERNKELEAEVARLREFNQGQYERLEAADKLTTELQDENARLREALMPFAKANENFIADDDYWQPEDWLSFSETNYVDARDCTVGDLRRAAEAVKEGE